jgi:hypothetical protein
VEVILFHVMSVLVHASGDGIDHLKRIVKLRVPDEVDDGVASIVDASDERCFVGVVRTQGGPGWEMVADSKNSRLMVVDIFVAHVGGDHR